ncbi:MAG: putative efflux rane fusion protein [Labilithrix sp.]|nr:putative efflux rane fusion protein [Labilithrix sp.]
MRRSSLRVACAVLGVLALGACAKPKDRRPAVAVRVEAVRPAAFASVWKYSGTVSAHTQVDLAFRVGGYVDSLASTTATAPQNARDDASFGASTDGAKTTARKTKRTKRPLHAGDRVAKGTVLASLRLSDFKQKMSELGGMSAEASAGYKKAKTDLQRAQSLLAEGAISRAEYDAVKARHDALAGGAGAAAARVGQAGLALSDAQLKAPIDAIILERRVEVGSLVAPGAPAFVLADTSMVKVSFGVPDSVQRSLELGQDVSVTADAFPDRSFSGCVTKIAPQADARTRVFDVEATLDNTEGLLKVGMVTNIQVGRGGDHEGPAERILLPLSAVVRIPPNEQGYWAYVVIDEPAGPTAHARPVELANLVGNRVAVTRGLTLGERVIVQGATLVREGQRVNVVPSAGTP